MAFYEHTFVGKQDLSDKEIDKTMDNILISLNKEFNAVQR